MNRERAKILAENVSDIEILFEMFRNVKKDKNFDFSKRCNVNKMMSFGTSFNIYVKCLNAESSKLPSELAIINMIRDFGRFLPSDFTKKVLFTKRKKLPKIVHQEPIEINF